MLGPSSGRYVLRSALQCAEKGFVASPSGESWALLLAGSAPSSPHDEAKLAGASTPPGAPTVPQAPAIIGTNIREALELGIPDPLAALCGTIAGQVGQTSEVSGTSALVPGTPQRP